MPRVQNPSLGTGQAPFQVNTINLTQAQILALPATPAIAVPAPGSGLMVVPIYFVFSYKFNTRRYFGNETLGIGLTVLTQAVSLYGNNIPNVVYQTQNRVAFSGPFLATMVDLTLFNNEPLILATDATTYGNGPIVTATLGAGGTGYVANDTGTITTGSADATYKVLTVGAGGAVLTFQITGAGTAYPTGNLQATATGGAQPGVGINFTCNITAVQPGDSTLKVVTYYEIVPVP